MDDNQLNQFINSLPKTVQDVLTNSEWEKRTIEVGKKYSLAPEQIDSLCNISILVITAMIKPEELLSVVVSDLAISNLLAEQIVDDLGSRVFEYALKLIDSKGTIKAPAVTTPTSRIPEIKPDNLPAIEIGEVSHAYVPERKTSPMAKPIEQAQKPYGVPRFGISQIPPKVQVLNMNQNTTPNPQNVMDSKLKNITTNIPVDMQKHMTPSQGNGPAPQMPPTKYAADPYREPLN